MNVPVHLEDLGPLRVRVAGETLAPTGRVTTSVVALLSLSSPAARSLDDLVDAIWTGRPTPPSARRSVVNVVSRLRRSTDPTIVESTAAGYRLGSAVGTDRDELARAVGEATSLLPRDVGRSLACCRAASERWRGVAWAGLDEPPEILVERARLAAVARALRRVEARALVATGRVDEAAIVLERMVAEDPSDEASWQLLASALAAVGRRADALVALDLNRRQLGARGLDPSTAALDLQRHLLAGEVLAPTG